ncbi:MAG: 16S rRNA (cytosine(1402)-N(4))-methyltransferase RsmH [Bacilli bacterium]|nr:16S rRNA (cytosine(1402)-N(4))-methyltransferase RsmH [Bacilli bacterium]MBR3209441.1 16S rRNA (cytosine(1402)-N(4))-methyltransferase RsmH [Bacilli bacterium]
MHISVLLEESVKYLNLKPNSTVVDCTLGYGGHSSEILKKIPNGFLYAFDQDEEAIKEAEKKLKKISDNYQIISKNFVNIKKELPRKVDGILFDLGVSSPQLDEDYRGFSYHNDAPLDMRMDQRQKLDAKEIVNNYPYEKLVKIFREYGEEKYSASIAKKIVENRPINTTLELAEIIKESVPESYRRKSHPARKIFQAIRIEVNDELNVFRKALTDSLELLNKGGRICVITFHSLEDRICKEEFKKVSEVPKHLQGLPIIPDEYKPKFKIIANIKPSDEEIENNKRSRSARLRVIERI